jgi:hypothetical protein
MPEPQTATITRQQLDNLWDQARKESKQGNHDQAIILLRDTIEKGHPNKVGLALGIMETYLKKGEPEDALKVFEEFGDLAGFAKAAGIKKILATDLLTGEPGSSSMVKPGSSGTDDNDSLPLESFNENGNAVPDLKYLASNKTYTNYDSSLPSGSEQSIKFDDLNGLKCLLKRDVSVNNLDTEHTDTTSASYSIIDMLAADQSNAGIHNPVYVLNGLFDLSATTDSVKTTIRGSYDGGIIHGEWISSNSDGITLTENYNNAGLRDGKQFYTDIKTGEDFQEVWKDGVCIENTESLNPGKKNPPWGKVFAPKELKSDIISIDANGAETHNFNQTFREQGDNLLSSTNKVLDEKGERVNAIELMMNQDKIKGLLKSRSAPEEKSKAEHAKGNIKRFAGNISRGLGIK